MTGLTRRTLLSCSPLLLAGCATGASIRKADLRLPHLMSGDLENAPAPTEQPWWLALGDPEVTGLIEAALLRNPDALQALAQIEVARAQRAQSLSAFGLLGGLSGNAQVQKTRILEGESVPAAGVGVAPGGNAGEAAGSAGQGGAAMQVNGSQRTAGLTLGLNWEIDLFGRAAAARAGGDAALTAAVANSFAARLTIAAAVADAAYEVKALASQLADAMYFERIQEDLERYARAREAAGVGNKADAERLAVRTAQLQADVIRLRAEERAATRRLLTLARRNNEPATNVVSSQLPVLPPAASELPSDLLLRRPDIRAAYERVRAETTRLNTADKELLPRLVLQPGASLFTSRTPVRTDSVTRFAGVSLTAPLFDRRRLIAAVREQGANAELAVIELERAADLSISEADQALILYRAELHRLPRLEEASKRAQQVRDSAARLFKERLLDVRAMLDAEREAREARAAWVEAQYMAARRLVETYRALGGAWTTTS